jgi:hypothetical protein
VICCCTAVFGAAQVPCRVPRTPKLRVFCFAVVLPFLLLLRCRVGCRGDRSCAR